ncbi:MAG: NAD(P)-dependent alcohol dehydrogenase [bacterium]|nr:NAD(P)-dependent alcohol dehydrogenase [bacterium]
MVSITYNMKAVGFYEYGGTEVLRLLDLPSPTPEKGQVLVQVMAAGVNPADWRFRDGQFKAFVRAKFPFVSGLEVAGIVKAVGEGVTRFKIGERVYGRLPTAKGGGYAEYVAINESALAHMPHSFNFSQAASVPLTALTALQALRDKAKLRNGQRILIYGASGGVGMFAVQLAKAYGAHVTAVCSTKNVDWVKSLGADVVIDYTSTDVLALPDRYEVIFDAVNHLFAKDAIAILEKGGVYVTVSPVVNPLVQIRARLMGKQVKTTFVKANGADLETISHMIDAGQLMTYIEKEYPLEYASEAHRQSATGHVRGKLVITIVNL